MSIVSSDLCKTGRTRDKELERLRQITFFRVVRVPEQCTVISYCQMHRQ